MSEITVRRTDHMHASELGRQDSQQRLLLMVLEKALHEMAHDLRSPLAGIRATSELLQEPEFRRSPDIETFLGNIDREINRLSQMVEGMTEALLIKLQAELKQQTRASDAVGTADNAAPHG